MNPMKIAVCVKRVPDTEARIKVGPDGKSLDPSGVETILSPYDEIALERAIQLKEAGAAEEVVVVSLGPTDATKEVRTGLAMGADRGVLLVDDTPRDAAATAKALAGALGGLGADLVLFGWKAIDTDASQVPFYVARELDVPVVSYAVGLDVEDGQVVVRREVEGTTQVLEVPQPAVVTVQKGLAEPRYASLKGIMMAKKKPLDQSDAPAADGLVEVVRMDPPPPRAAGRIVGEGAEAVPALLDALHNEAKVL
jgi:electron transfer flavoprotein beta subunit